MKGKTSLRLLVTGILLLPARPAIAQGVASSRLIPFANVPTTIPPGTPGQVLTLRLLDDTTPPTALYCETQTLDVDLSGAVSFNLGVGGPTTPPCPSQPPGLKPGDFASGSSRFLDIVDITGASVLPLPQGPVPLAAVAFALSPGPMGTPGRDGQIQSVAAGDASIAVAGGTGPTPTIAVAAAGITNRHIADGALSPAKISGSAATLGANTFTGNQTINGTVTATTVGNVGLRGHSNLYWGVYGSSNTDTGVYGFSSSGTGVVGESAGSGYGLFGRSRNGPGVYGWSFAGLAGLFDGTVQVNGSLIQNTPASSSISGSLGIGTSPTVAKLHVVDTTIGGAVAGYSRTGAGVFGQVESASGYGVYGTGPGLAMYANGNAGQSRDKGGWVKAMIYVNENGTINRCFNALLEGPVVSIPPCGFSASRFTSGGYEVDFGFRVDDRFYSLSVQSDSANKSNGIEFQLFSPTVLDIYTYVAYDGTRNSAPFMVIVY